MLHNKYLLLEKFTCTAIPFFLNEPNKGVHIIDNSNPASPINKSFISIPGNYDIAVKGNILYADCFTDLLALDISNINNISLKNYLANVYPEKRWVNGYYLDSGFVAIDWIKKDTVVDANFERNNYWLSSSLGGVLFSSSATGVTTTGTGGSMAKLTIVNNKLYTINSSDLLAIDISNATAPSFLSSSNLHLGIGTPETIYPFQDKLFIGSTSGMYIFSIANASQPQLIKTFSHATACDPVISDGTYAYITLRSGTECSGIKNELNIVDVSNIQNPVLLKTYNMSNPKGLAKDGNLLMICDNVLKIYDAANVSDLQLKNSIPISNPYDVICLNNTAIITAANGLYQYNYSNPNNIQFLSKITITPLK